MKRISYIVPRDYQENRVFNVEDRSLNRDDCLRPMAELRRHLATLGVQIDTDDITSPGQADAILMENAPVENAVSTCAALKRLGKPMFLNASESIFVLPANADPTVFSSFDRVFTFQDELVRGNDPTFHKFNYTFTLPRAVDRSDVSAKKMLCCIAGNKRMKHVGELYSERVRLIRWYERCYPAEFDLYGIGWDRPNKAAAPWFNRKVIVRPFSSWKGAVPNKAEVMRQYKFALCFENAADVSGYITEKIFDAMMAGCVPVYRGADNIAEHIPANCFIDYRTFETSGEMREALVRMSKEEHERYLDAIERFFQSPASNPFRHSFFVNTLSREICTLLDVAFWPMEDKHA